MLCLNSAIDYENPSGLANAYDTNGVHVDLLIITQLMLRGNTFYFQSTEFFFCAKATCYSLPINGYILASQQFLWCNLMPYAHELLQLNVWWHNDSLPSWSVSSYFYPVFHVFKSPFSLIARLLLTSQHFLTPGMDSTCRRSCTSNNKVMVVWGYSECKKGKCLGLGNNRNVINNKWFLMLLYGLWKV